MVELRGVEPRGASAADLPASPKMVENTRLELVTSECHSDVFPIATNSPWWVPPVPPRILQFFRLAH